MRLFHSLSLSILLISLLTSCATDSSRDPRAPRKYYIPENETIHKAEIYYADKTADFIVTENAIYVMYSRNYAYLNPAFSCHFDSFPHDPVLEEDWIKVDCSKGGGSQWIGKWFQFTDKSNAKITFDKMSTARSGAIPVIKKDSSYKSDSDLRMFPRHFEVTEDIVFRTKISYGGKDTELVITDLAVYVLYGGSDVAMNPAYECFLKDIVTAPVEKSDQIGITCNRSRRDGLRYSMHYFHIPNANNRAIALQKIYDLITEKNISIWDEVWRKKHLVLAEESLKTIGVISSEACIPDEMINNGQNGPNAAFVFDPTAALHPEIAGYVAADPALLAGVLFGGIFVDIENLSQNWKTIRAEKKRRKELRKKTVDPRKETPEIGSSSELSLALAVTADSILHNKVVYVTEICESIEEEVINRYRLLSDSFSTIIDFKDYSGELINHQGRKEDSLDTELLISSFYTVVDTKNGYFKGVNMEYVNSQPLNVYDKKDVNEEVIEEVIMDAYRDISTLIIDGILNNIEQK